MKTTISELPRDLIEEIFARVPMKSIRAVVRLTCKKWNTLSKGQMSVAKKHIDKVARGEIKVLSETTMIALMDKSLYLKSVDIDHPSIELKGKLSCLNEQVIKISQVFHCEGLLLCVLEDDTRLVVWNPYCGQTTWIESRWYPHHSNGFDLLQCALGYEDKKSGRTFKLLRFIDYTMFIFPSREQTPGEHFSWYEIYDFDSGLWTTLDVTPYWWYIQPFNIGVSLKGNTYWFAAKLNDDLDSIICFDFTKERFGPLLPLPSYRVRWYNEQISTTISCIREEKLSAFSKHYYSAQLDDDDDRYYPDEVQIWITTKIEDKKISWSNVFNFKPYDYYPKEIRDLGSYYFIDEEKKVATSFNMKRKSFVTFGEAGYSSESSTLLDPLDPQVSVMMNSQDQFWFCYVPSLAQIKKPRRGGKRKRQNSLEKSRFAQNMLRLFVYEKLYSKSC